MVPIFIVTPMGSRAAANGDQLQDLGHIDRRQAIFAPGAASAVVDALLVAEDPAAIREAERSDGIPPAAPVPASRARGWLFDEMSGAI